MSWEQPCHRDSLQIRCGQGPGSYYSKVAPGGHSSVCGFTSREERHILSRTDTAEGIWNAWVCTHRHTWSPFTQIPSHSTRDGQVGPALPHVRGCRSDLSRRIHRVLVLVLGTAMDLSWNICVLVMDPPLNNSGILHKCFPRRTLRKVEWTFSQSLSSCLLSILYLPFPLILSLTGSEVSLAS